MILNCDICGRPDHNSEVHPESRCWREQGTQSGRLDCFERGYVRLKAEVAAAEERGRRRGVEERDERVRLCQLFVLAARWLIAGLQRDVEASEPAVLLYTPLKVAALRVVNAFQPPGTVRSFTGPESTALNELAATARARAPASNKPLGGEAGEWWQAALQSLDLPSIPWGREMEQLRAALAPRDSGKEGQR